MSPLTYDQALAELAAIAQAEAGPELNPRCRSFALTHGRRAARCTVLLHGYTNCPRQFHRFAAELHARGHSVYVPRLPFHGLADRLSEEHARLSRGSLLGYLDAAIAVAHGLGERVGVLGLSAGGNLAAFAAQHRADVAQAVVIAPVLGTPGLPAWTTAPLALLALAIPNQFRWWDPINKLARRGPLHAYPRFSTRAMAAVVRLGLEVARDARRAPPRAGDIVVVINEADPAVTLPPIEALARRWRARGAPIREHRFPAALDLIHDLMDPDQERQQLSTVYPALLDLVGPT